MKKNKQVSQYNFQFPESESIWMGKTYNLITPRIRNSRRNWKCGCNSVNDLWRHHKGLRDHQNCETELYFQSSISPFLNSIFFMADAEQVLDFKLVKLLLRNCKKERGFYNIKLVSREKRDLFYDAMWCLTCRNVAY